MSHRSPKKQERASIANIEGYNAGIEIIDQIQLRLITYNKEEHGETIQFTAQQISAEGDSKEKQLIKRLEKIITIRNELLTPFLEYSQNIPHVLVSKYEEPDILIPKDSKKQVKDNKVYYLSQVFHETRKSPVEWLDDTAKTKIALCIAKGMKYLHDKGIIHENLQPCTIKIVGDSYLPHIIDYGLNEFRGPPSEASSQRYLAPELKTISDYSKETDVFAFGVLLCELLASKNYKNAAKPPTNINKAPKKLKKLIIQCLSQNPDDRPTFSEIYELFKNHTIQYQETDENDVDDVISKLEEFDIRHKNMIFKPLLKMTLDNVPELYSLARKVTPDNAESFFNIIGNNFGPKTDIKLFKELLNVTQLFVQEKIFCQIFVKTETHLNLPFDKEPLYPQILNIAYWIVQHDPDAIQSISEGLAIIMQFPKYTKKILILCTVYVKKWFDVNNPWTFFDQILASLKNKELKYQSNFISIFYTLCSKIPRYRKGRLRHCVNYISSMIDSTNHSTIRAVYAFLAEFKDEQIPKENAEFFYDYSAKHLVDPHTALATVKFLLIKENILITPDLVRSAIRLASTSHLGNLLLCKIAEDAKGNTYLMKLKDFIEVPLPDYESTLRVLLILLRKKGNKDEYRRSESLPFFLSKLVQNADLKMIRNIQNLLSIIKCDSKFIDELDENNFCDDFFVLVSNNGDEPTMKNLLTIFINFALRNPTLKFFKKLIKQLRENLSLMNNDPNVSVPILQEILSLFAVLSAVPDYAPLFSDMRIDTEFKKLTYKNRDPEVKDMIQTFKDNMERHKRRLKKRSQSVS